MLSFDGENLFLKAWNDDRHGYLRSLGITYTKGTSMGF